MIVLAISENKFKVKKIVIMSRKNKFDYLEQSSSRFIRRSTLEVNEFAKYFNSYYYLCENIKVICLINI